MTLSSNALEAALSEWTDETPVDCLTIDHADLASPILLVNDQANLVRSAGTFLAFPFAVREHEKSEDGVGQAELRADAVDQSLIDDLRTLQSGLAITHERVLVSSPNVVEYGPVAYELRSVVSDGVTLSLIVAFAMDMLADAFPAAYFAPWNSGD